MAKRSTQFVCQACGSVAPKWTGRCEGCGAWNSLTEEAAPAVPGGRSRGARRAERIELMPLQGESKERQRLLSGIDEFDRVCGGGLVPGSAILIGGDPGIGKSTLLLQVAASLSGTGDESSLAVYVSGEESIEQVRMRARRMGLQQAGVRLATATLAEDIVAAMERMSPLPRTLVIDSVQTMHSDAIDAAPGTVSQVRMSAQRLIHMAKQRGIALLLVGHVTKEGVIAGPKVLEHMVDTVLTFEGERGHQFRILRTAKNRYGPTDEIGVFEMTEAGLEEVKNPSALFLAERRGNTSGTAVFAGVEGTRPVLVELQALVCPSPLATPRRAAVGWDSGRLAMLLAVLEARCGLAFSGQEVYLNVVGGLRIGEPGADLAVAAALISALAQGPIPEDVVIFGEVGLSGELRGVSQEALRLKEAEKLGFTKAFIPTRRARQKEARERATAISMIELAHLHDLLAELGIRPGRPQSRRMPGREVQS